MAIIRRKSDLNIRELIRNSTSTKYHNPQESVNNALFLETIQAIPGSGYVGTPGSYSTVDTPLLSGPYTTYECPVIQPISATQAYMSPGEQSNTYCVHTHIRTHNRNCTCTCTTARYRPHGLHSQGSKVRQNALTGNSTGYGAVS